MLFFLFKKNEYFAPILRLTDMANEDIEVKRFDTLSGLFITLNLLETDGWIDDWTRRFTDELMPKYQKEFEAAVERRWLFPELTDEVIEKYTRFFDCIYHLETYWRKLDYSLESKASEFEYMWDYEEGGCWPFPDEMPADLVFDLYEEYLVSSLVESSEDDYFSYEDLLNSKVSASEVPKVTKVADADEAADE
jgi:hypothetical protein